VRTRSLILGIAAALACSAPAIAQLSNDQQACVLGLGKSVWKIEKQVAKQASTCLTDFAKGEVPSVEACVASDPTGKIAKMTDKATADYGKFCTPPPTGKLDDPFPPFGATDDATVIAEGTRAAADLAHDLFGADLDAGALSTDRDGSSCQRGLWKAASICALIRLKNLSSCQKDALATAASKAELRDACLGAGTDGQPDPTGKIAKKCADVSAGIPGAVAKKCDGQDLSALVPGCANADAGACLQQKTACHVCLAASQAQDLDRDCDLFDDGLDNASCDRGPIDVVCDAPSGASMIQVAPGATVTFQGHASHPAGIDSVTVNGTGVTVAPDGSFELPVTASYGVNFVDVVATNAVGEQRAVACTFIAAGSYLGETSFVTNGYNLALRQSAIDDANRTGPLDSLAEVAFRIVNSSALGSTLDTTLLAANPLKPSACDSQTCTFFGCICWFSSGVTYQSLSILGPNTVSLTLVNGGLATVGRIEDLAVRLRVTGGVSGISFDTSGWVRLDWVQVNQTSDIALDGLGRPDVSHRAGSLNVTVGNIAADFSGLDGWFIDNIIIPLAQGPIRTLVSNVIGTYVRDRFNFALDDLLSGINLDSGATINVPTVGGGALSIALADQSASVNVTATRALFGMSSRFTASPAAHARSSLGVALAAPGTPCPDGDDRGRHRVRIPARDQPGVARALAWRPLPDLRRHRARSVGQYRDGERGRPAPARGAAAGRRVRRRSYASASAASASHSPSPACSTRRPTTRSART
jgi:hypothetical protein